MYRSFSNISVSLMLQKGKKKVVAGSTKVEVNGLNDADRERMEHGTRE